MTEIRFYHMLYDKTDQIIPDLLQKALDKNMRVLLKLPNAERLGYYDDWLWRFQPESFLPHGTDQDTEKASEQPVLLTLGDTPLNDARMALVVEEAELPPTNDFDLICYLFDSENPSRLQKARHLWKELKERSGLTLTYWQQQTNGRWIKQDI